MIKFCRSPIHLSYASLGPSHMHVVCEGHASLDPSHMHVVCVGRGVLGVPSKRIHTMYLPALLNVDHEMLGGVSWRNI